MVKLMLLVIIVFLIGISYREYKRYKIYMEVENKLDESDINMKSKVVKMKTALIDKAALEMDSKINELKGDVNNDEQTI